MTCGRDKLEAGRREKSRYKLFHLYTGNIDSYFFLNLGR